MSAADLSELLAQVESAPGPNYELEVALAVALLGWCTHPLDRQRDDSAQSDRGYTCLDCGADSWGNTGPSGQHRHAKVPNATASLDAALTLLERALPGWAWSVGNVSRGGQAFVMRLGGSLFGGEAATPALAVCAALLKALSAQDASPSPRVDA